MAIHARLIHVALALVAAGHSLVAFAQPVPPDQQYVIEFGSSSRAHLGRSFTQPEEYTIDTWIFLKPYSQGGMIIGEEIEGDPFYTFALMINGDETALRADFMVSSGQPGSFRSLRAENVNSGEWMHLAVTRKGTELSLYVNGMLESQMTLDIEPIRTVEDVFVGNSHIHSPLQGYLRQLRVWSAAMSAAEVGAIAGQHYDSHEALVANWTMDQESVNQIVDLSGNDYHLEVEADGYFPRSLPVEIVDSPYYTASPVGTPTNPMRSVLIDYSLDGHLDLVSPEQEGVGFARRPIQLYKYIPENRAFAIDTDHGFSQQNPQMNVVRDFVVADLNSDGLDDLFMAGHGADAPLVEGGPLPGEQSRLFLQNGTGQLIDVSSTHLPQELGLTHSVTSGDIDNDGDVDLFLGNSPGAEGNVPPKFYINDGQGRFSLTSAYSLPPEIVDLQVNVIDWILADFNRDGHLDLYGGRGDAAWETQAKDVYLLNDGRGTFDYAPDAWLPVRGEGEGWGTQVTSVGDFNNDGFLDLLLSAYIQTQHAHKDDAWIQLFLNRGDGSFVEESETWLPGYKYGGNGDHHPWIVSRDLNGDGWTDFYAYGSSTYPLAFYVNRGGTAFEKVPAEVFDPSPGPIEILANDFDDDGGVDLLVLAGNPESDLLWSVRPYGRNDVPLSVPQAPVLSLTRSAPAGADTLFWSTSTTPFHATHLEIARDRDFTNMVLRLRDYGAEFFPLNGIDADAQLFARARVANSAGWSPFSEVITIGDGTSISRSDEVLPAVFALRQNFPNPFNPRTEICYSLAVPQHVTLAVFDVTGHRVRTLVEGMTSAGEHSASFDASALPSGIYFYRLQTASFSDVKKMLLIR